MRIPGSVSRPAYRCCTVPSHPTITAFKEIIADQIKVAMDKKGLSKTAMAARMKTSRRQLDRLLDPANTSVTLATLRRAASAVGRNLRVELE